MTVSITTTRMNEGFPPLTMATTKINKYRVSTCTMAMTRIKPYFSTRRRDDDENEAYIYRSLIHHK